MNTKICNRCQKEHDLSNFYLRKDRHTYMPYCKNCKYTRAKPKLIIKDNNIFKNCSSCKIQKEIAYFNKDLRRINGYSSQCKECLNYKAKNRPNRKLSVKKYADKNRLDINAHNRKKYHEDRIKSAEYNRLKKIRLRAANPEHYREYNRKAALKRYYDNKNNPNYKIPRILRGRFITAVKREYKTTSVIKLLGCSIEDARKYIESKWLIGMTWENHGLYKKDKEKTWHIDHIIPCSKFDLTKESEQRKCFHYTNLQPLWAPENLEKSNRVSKIGRVDFV